MRGGDGLVGDIRLQRSGESTGNKKTKASNKKKTTAHFTNGFIESLLVPVETSNKEAGSKAQQQVCEDGTEDGGLDDFYENIGGVVFVKQYHEEHDFDDAAKKGFQNHA